MLFARGCDGSALLARGYFQALRGSVTSYKKFSSCGSERVFYLGFVVLGMTVSGSRIIFRLIVSGIRGRVALRFPTLVFVRNTSSYPILDGHAH